MGTVTPPPASPFDLADHVERLRRSPLMLGLVSLICGLGFVAASVTLVRATDDAGVFDFFRSDRVSRFIDPIRLRPRYAVEPRLRRRKVRRYAARPPAKPARILRERRQFAMAPRRGAEQPAIRPPVQRKARVEFSANNAIIAGRQTMCVRSCDGFAFPLGDLYSRADLPTHQAGCQAACPGAETVLYTMGSRGLENPSGARSIIDGSPYGSLKTAFLFRKQAVPSCSCQGPGHIAKLVPILLDPTLRHGDVVVDREGDAKVFAGSNAMPRKLAAFSDYDKSPALTRTAKRDVDRVIGTSQRAAVARSYAASQRRREAALAPPVTVPAPVARPIQVARAPEIARAPEAPRRYSGAGFREVAAPAGSAASVRVFTISQGGGTVHASGARIIPVP